MYLLLTTGQEDGASRRTLLLKVDIANGTPQVTMRLEVIGFLLVD